MTLVKLGVIVFQSFGLLRFAIAVFALEYAYSGVENGNVSSPAAPLPTADKDCKRSVITVNS